MMGNVCGGAVDPALGFRTAGPDQYQRLRGLLASAEVHFVIGSRHDLTNSDEIQPGFSATLENMALLGQR